LPSTGNRETPKDPQTSSARKVITQQSITKVKKHHTNKMAALHPRRHGLGANVSRVVLRAHMRHDTLAHGCRLPSNMIAYAVGFILQHRLGMLGVISNALID
jgi:hypothetical protein